MSGVRGGWGVGKGTHKRGERAHCSSSSYLVRAFFSFVVDKYIQMELMVSVDNPN